MINLINDRINENLKKLRTEIRKLSWDIVAFLRGCIVQSRILVSQNRYHVSYGWTGFCAIGPEQFDAVERSFCILCDTYAARPRFPGKSGRDFTLREIGTSSVRAYRVPRQSLTGFSQKTARRFEKSIKDRRQRIFLNVPFIENWKFKSFSVKLRSLRCKDINSPLIDYFWGLWNAQWGCSRLIRILYVILCFKNFEELNRLFRLSFLMLYNY